MSETPDTPLAASYDNNNEANTIKMKQQRMSLTENKHVTNNKRNATAKNRICARLHLNSLWSVWYGFFGTFLQAYTAVKCTKRFLRYSVLPWTSSAAVWELQACFLVTGLAVLLLPFFSAAAVFKVGNLANDGFKLGRASTLCEKDPKTALLGPKCSLWKHGAPTASFVHLLIAFILLVPKLVMEARLIEAGFLPNEVIWRTDLDFMIVHHDRLVVLSFMTATSSNSSSLSTSTPISNTQIETTTLSTVLNTTRGQTALPHSIVKVLKDFLNIDETESNFDSGFGSSVSVEYMNYALALFVYSVRYPAVFWNTNKCFGIIFSVQLLANSLQSLLAFAGMSVLYKVQIIGAWKALPLLRHYPDGMSPLGGKSPFLLNPHVTLALFALSSLLVLSSSLILYLYGHGRFNSFLNQQRTHKHIFISPSFDSNQHSWGYFTHCAALCVLAAVAVVYAPLLYDYTVVYRGSLDGAVLACIIASILHLFLWVLVWLLLTVKHQWSFKLRVTVGRATVRSARSVKLVTDVSLGGAKSESASAQPLLVVVGNGRAYTVTDPSPKRAIMGVVQRASKSNSANSSTTAGSETADDDNDEQIYWLRPAIVSAKKSPTNVDTNGAESPETRLCWFSKPKSQQAGQLTKHKVTFKEASSTSNIRCNKEGGVKPKIRPGGGSKLDEDDGDYATLRELPIISTMVREHEEDTTSEEGKLIACFHDDNVTYASTSRDLLPPTDYEDPSPLLTPEPLNDRGADEAQTAHTTNPTNNNNNTNVTVHTQVVGLQTPRCLRRADSGMPPEELTPRSDTSSPPEAISSNHSESSSGIHSNASSETNHNHVPENNHQQSTSRRATSVANLVQAKEDQQWKSSSLQRNIQPHQVTQVTQVNNPLLASSSNNNQNNNNTSGNNQQKQDKRVFGMKNDLGGYGYIDKEALRSIVGNRNGSNSLNTTETPVKTTSSYSYKQANEPDISVRPNSSGYSYASVTQNTDPDSTFKPSTVRSNSAYGYTTSNQQMEPDLTSNHPPSNRYSTDITDLTKSGSNAHFNSMYGYTAKPNSSESQDKTKPTTTNSNYNHRYTYASSNSVNEPNYTTSEGDATLQTCDVEPVQKTSNTFYNCTQNLTGGIPAIILENACENTVVIRRKLSKPSVNEHQIPVITEEPFGRSTNMKMISFTEHKDLKNIQASSATLPIYPTQPIQNTQYVHCSTMPLPHNSGAPSAPQSLGQNTTSCNFFPRQHTTIPTHHNGVRLFSNQNSPVKRSVNFQRSISEK